MPRGWTPSPRSIRPRSSRSPRPSTVVSTRGAAPASTPASPSSTGAERSTRGVYAGHPVRDAGHLLDVVTSHRAGAASHLRHECRARARRGPVRPGSRAPAQPGQAAPHRPAGDADGRARLGGCVGALLRGGAGRRRSRQGRATFGTLRAMAGIQHPRAGSGRASNPAGAVRRHGGGVAPHAVIPSDAARDAW